MVLFNISQQKGLDALNKVLQFMQTPSMAHWEAVKRVLCYPNGTISHGPFLMHCPCFDLHAYFDLDRDRCPGDLRSQDALCTYFGPNLICGAMKEDT